MKTPLRSPLAARFRGSSFSLRLLLTAVGAPWLAAQVQNPTNVTAISLTAQSLSVFQDFDTLSSTAASPVLPPGWLMSETGAPANSTYGVGNGSSAIGNTYSFGSAGSFERALGTLGGVNGLQSAIGAVFVNNTGSTITSLTFTFFGEQWRSGLGLPGDLLVFGFNPNVTVAGNSAILTTGSFVGDPFLDVLSTVSGGAPGSTGGVGMFYADTLNNLSIPDGQSFAIRWVDVVRGGGADDGLAIDNFAMFATISAVPEPTTWAAGALLLGAVGWHQRRRFVVRSGRRQAT